MTKRARRNADRPDRRQPLDARRGSRVEDVCSGEQRLEHTRLLAHQQVDLLVAEEQAEVGRYLPERAFVVEAEVPLAVVVLRQPDAVRREDLLIAAQMQRLGIGELGA
jgi:hypothetical protein